MSQTEQYARAVCRACILRSVTPTELAQRCGIAPLTMKHLLPGSTQRPRLSTMRWTKCRAGHIPATDVWSDLAFTIRWDVSLPGELCRFAVGNRLASP